MQDLFSEVESGQCQHCGGLGLPEGCPDCGTAAVDPPSIEEMCFTAEELELLREAGILDRAAVAWCPTTLEDVDWVCWKAQEMKREMEALAARAEARISRLEKLRSRFLDRYVEACKQIVDTNLPRKKDGSYARKSLDLDRVRVQLRSIPGGPRITDEATLLAYIQTTDPLGETPLGEAVQVSRTEVLHGGNALTALRTSVLDIWKPKVLAAPVKSFVGSLPPVPDPETGEARPATIPGVTLVEPGVTFTFE